VNHIDDTVPIRLQVSFDAPSSIDLELQGLALQAYYRWLKDPSDDNEEALTDAIYSQCEHYVVTWSTVREWNHS